MVGSLPLSIIPRTPKGHKRPADVIGNAVTVMKIATGEIDESAVTEDGKNAAAVAFGRKGGFARAKSIKKADCVHIARKGTAFYTSNVEFYRFRDGSAPAFIAKLGRLRRILERSDRPSLVTSHGP
jgi:hypothetical protein